MIRTFASPIVGQDQVFRGVSVLCWHVALVANVLLKPHKMSNSVFRSRPVIESNIGVLPDQWRVSL